MTRFVLPELFYAAGAPIVTGGKQQIALRWILHPSLGLPRALFHVWQFGGRLEQKKIEIRQETSPGAMRLVTWSGGPAVSVQLTLSVASGSAELRAYSVANGAGHVVDQKTVVGPVGSIPVVLTGTPIASIITSANVTILSASFIPMDEFANHPDWKLLETVGLPVTRPAFDSSGYPLSPQGPVGAELDPVDAAIRRVKTGTPDSGWPATTDRGTGVTPFAAPDPDTLVHKEVMPLVLSMGELLTTVAEPSEQAATEVSLVTEAPRSVVGAAASPTWQARARPARVMPLGAMLLAAGTDPFAALALGFGTTLGIKRQQPTQMVMATTGSNAIFMITVAHKVNLKKKLPFGLEVNLAFEGELVAFYLGQSSNLPTAPAGLAAGTGVRRLDPPQLVDDRWLEVAELSWAKPVTLSVIASRPGSYAIARGTPTETLEIRNEKRLSGGPVPFVSATGAGTDQPASIRYTELGLPEMLPGEPPTWVYSVAAQDWFGRWSGWASTDHARTSVAPQIPGIRKVELLTEGSILPTQTVPVAIEFTWDWSYRTPAQIHLRILTHAEVTDPPAVNGSVFRIGGSTEADHIINFSTAAPNTPPVGVELIADETLGKLRTYRVTLPGVELTFGSHPRIAVSARARATERIVPTRLSAWSRDVRTSAASPVPPPAPFVPAEMCWASVPDPRGIARTTLGWTATAPLYAVYTADETALLRELDQPSANLELPAADRLTGLRSLPIGTARRAFRRVADRVPASTLEVTLPRGSRLIHFYGIVPISATGVEGNLPVSANAYFAVAAPTIKTPEPPLVIARDQTGTVSLQIEAPETRVAVGRIEVFRAPSRHRAASVEDMGPPIIVVDASLGVHSAGWVRFQLEDPTPGPVWQSVFYRAVTWGLTERDRGVYGGRSLPSPAIEVVPGAPLPPSLNDLMVENVPSQPDYRLVSFLSNASLARTPRGTHAFAMHVILLDASIRTRRVAADALPLIDTTLPTPSEQPETIFRYDPVNPRIGRIYAWVLRDVRAIIVEVADPAGRTSRETWEVV